MIPTRTRVRQCRTRMTEAIMIIRLATSFKVSIAGIIATRTVYYLIGL